MEMEAREKENERKHAGVRLRSLAQDQFSSVCINGCYTGLEKTRQGQLGASRWPFESQDLTCLLCLSIYLLGLETVIQRLLC